MIKRIQEDDQQRFINTSSACLWTSLRQGTVDVHSLSRSSFPTGLGVDGASCQPNLARQLRSNTFVHRSRAGEKRTDEVSIGKRCQQRQHSKFAALDPIARCSFRGANSTSVASKYLWAAAILVAGSLRLVSVGHIDFFWILRDGRVDRKKPDGMIGWWSA